MKILWLQRFLSPGTFPVALSGEVYGSQTVIRACTRWRIGSGLSARVLEDAWLLDNQNLFIVSRHPALQNQHMFNLMKMDRIQEGMGYGGYSRLVC